MKKVELALEHFIFASRWLLVSFYVGLASRYTADPSVFWDDVRIDESHRDRDF